MRKNITVFAGDGYLRRKIYLMLSPLHDVICADIFETPTREELGADIVIWNVSEKPLPKELSSYAVTLGDGGDVPLPFTEEMLLSAISESEEKTPEELLTLGEKCAHIYGKTVRLTDVEFALITPLVEAGGEFVTREELISRVWGDSATAGVLNVYIHYLREKIEFRGEKIIISSRSAGYKIDRRFLTYGGEDRCLE